MRAITVIFGLLCAASSALAQGPPVALAGLKAAASITRDTLGIAHIQAQNEHDLFFLQGFIHAQDRLFQMDLSRRQASGTLAEVLGPGALASDVQLRTLGLRRAAQRSLQVLSPRARAALEAYAAGVNAFVASHPLPPEYGLLELTQFQPWTLLDSVVIGKLIAFSLSFDLDIGLTLTLKAYQQAGMAGGFNGTALFFEDLFRSAPFDPAATVPDASVADATAFAASSAEPGAYARSAAAAFSSSHLHPSTLELGQQYLEKIKDLPAFENVLDRERRGGSNEWAVAGAHTSSGLPMIANDPHLALDVPSTFYPIHLQAGPMNVVGSSFAGLPAVVVGHNQFISWGATSNPMDVTDVF